MVTRDNGELHPRTAVGIDEDGGMVEADDDDAALERIRDTENVDGEVR